MNLQQIGFNSYFEKQSFRMDEQQLIGRVIVEHKHTYRIITEQGELLATISGSYAYKALAREHYPAVGDFVIVTKMPGEQRAVIHQLFERKSKFARKMAGTTLVEQIVAANVDTLFIVMSLNADFNERRLERYAVAAWDSGAVPVIVLTKADLCEDATLYRQKVQAVAFGVDVVVVSALTGEGIEQLKCYISEGQTVALIGSSGAGKSTIVNVLTQTAEMKVASIREDDAKGRHTTTHRELLFVPAGGCLIDTPGMRELQLWTEESSLQEAFQDIEQLAEQCYYRDCQHMQEPHCAVLRAVADGVLDKARLKSYFKLQKELQFIESKTSVQLKLAEKQKWKKISKQLKHK